MTNERLDELQAVCDAATAGPWELWDGCSWRRFGSAATGATVCEPTIHSSDACPDLWFRNGGQDGPDARFIATARTAMPELIARVRELEAMNTALYDNLEDLLESHR